MFVDGPRISGLVGCCAVRQHSAPFLNVSLGDSAMLKDSNRRFHAVVGLKHDCKGQIRLISGSNTIDSTHNGYTAFT